MGLMSMSVAFAPDGRTLASASADKSVKLWDVQSRKEVATLTGHGNAVWSVAFAPDGRTLASASGDKSVKLWDVQSRKEAGHAHRACGLMSGQWRSRRTGGRWPVRVGTSR